MIKETKVYRAVCDICGNSILSSDDTDLLLAMTKKNQCIISGKASFVCDNCLKELDIGGADNGR